VTENADFSHLANDVKRYDYDRWLCTLFAPPEVRNNLITVLAFNIDLARIRETVSESLIGDIRLQWWRDALQDLSKGISKPHPVVQSLQRLNDDIPLNLELMLEMVDMRAKDLDPAPMATDGELIVYADLTGGALHQLMYQVMGAAENSTALEAVIRSGRSYALAGILRAMPFHAQNGLVLIPEKHMDHYGVTAETIFKPENEVAFHAIVGRLHRLATAELSDARAQAGQIDKRRRAAIFCNALTGIYLQRLKASRYDPVSEALTVGPVRKIIALFGYRLFV